MRQAHRQGFADGESEQFASWGRDSGFGIRDWRSATGPDATQLSLSPPLEKGGRGDSLSLVRLLTQTKTPGRPFERPGA
ncbi:hypothetical protein LC55x_4346 [Lysobacter capsici]|nr:hypothetical protein LC55x_4346 [Lysobacter capsici]